MTVAARTMAPVFALGLFAGWAVCADVRTEGDASLHDVQFLDKHEGWAVGDQGTVWHTMDAGIVWERQPTGTRATLTSIHMQNFLTGWISSRESLPYNPGSIGQLLFTDSGGGRWANIGRQVFSGLQMVHFSDEEHGWVLGESTDMHPSGLYYTSTGAKSWHKIQGERFPGWTRGYIHDFDFGILGGHDRSFATFRKGVVLPAHCDWLPGTTIRDFGASNNEIWAVGDRAQIFLSSDRGKTWTRPEIQIPPEIRSVWDFRAVSVVGDHLWVIGRPGSVVLHSPDSGKSWTVQKTGQTLPMNAIWFCDGLHGWAVGALGTILATKDGGETWQVQRPFSFAKEDEDTEPSQRKAAILWLNDDTRRVPLSVVARYGGQQGYLVVALALTAPDLGEDPPGSASRPARMAEAFRAVGGALAESCWKFPLQASRANDPVEKLIGEWNELHEGEAPQEIQRELVMAIRMWQPAVVVTDVPLQPPAFRESRVQSPESRAGVQNFPSLDSQLSTLNSLQPPASRAAALVALGTRQAVRAASDPTVFPEQIELLDLGPHSVAKLYAHQSAVSGQRSAVSSQRSAVSFQPPASRLQPKAKSQKPKASSHITLDSSDIGSRLGESYADVAEAGLALALESFEEIESQARFVLLDSAIKNAENHKSLVAGLGLETNRSVRRDLEPISDQLAERIRKNSERKRNILAIARRPPSENTQENLLAHLPESAVGLDMLQGGNVIFGIARGYVTSGKWDLAQPTFEYLAANYPQHPLTLEAFRWLIAFQTSQEARRRLPPTAIIRRLEAVGWRLEDSDDRSGRRGKSGQRSAVSGQPPASRLQPKAKSQKPKAKSLQSHSVEVLKEPGADRRMLGLALVYGKGLRATSPQLWADSRVQFCLAAAHRQLGNLDIQDAYFGRIIETDPNSRWAKVVALEKWWRKPIGTPPRAIAWSVFTDRRPYLDGQMDDECWKAGKMLRLRSDKVTIDEEFETLVAFRHDREFLYIAADCLFPDPSYQKDPVPRTGRDAQIDQSDRIEIILDTDRDYNTFYRLRIDQRGLVAEDCWGDVTWNPRWFVASRQTERSWMIEIAIPLTELTEPAGLTNQTWAFNIMRVVPGKAILSWSRPVATEVRPDGFSHLKFVRRDSQKAGPPKAN